MVALTAYGASAAQAYDASALLEKARKDSEMNDHDREPPMTVGLMFCRTCGRNDRYTPFGHTLRHSVGGNRCPGVPVRVVYENPLVPSDFTPEASADSEGVPS